MEKSPLIFHGDCITMLPQLPRESVGLVVTDPPYVCKYRDRNGRAVANDDHAEWIAPAFREIYRVMAPDSFCVSFYGWQHVERFMQAWKGAGLEPVGHIVWQKGYASRLGHLAARHEQAFLLAKGKPRRAGKCLPDVLPWTYSGNPLHPTQKAVEVIEPLIKSFSQPGDLVLDPFLGSGTTGVAAALCGRRFAGIEMDPEHFATAQARVRRAYEGLPDDIANDNEVLVYANGALA